MNCNLANSLLKHKRIGFKHPVMISSKDKQEAEDDKEKYMQAVVSSPEEKDSDVRNDCQESLTLKRLDIKIPKYFDMQVEFTDNEDTFMKSFDWMSNNSPFSTFPDESDIDFISIDADIDMFDF